jgi:hypothetical protein
MRMPTSRQWQATLHGRVSASLAALSVVPQKPRFETHAVEDWTGVSTIIAGQALTAAKMVC